MLEGFDLDRARRKRRFHCHRLPAALPGSFFDMAKVITKSGTNQFLAEKVTVDNSMKSRHTANAVY
jgi:hypothetical protein